MSEAHSLRLERTVLAGKVESKTDTELGKAEVGNSSILREQRATGVLSMALGFGYSSGLS